MNVKSNVWKTALAGIVCGLLAACGGGGSANDPSASYTGDTTQAAISGDMAEEMVLAAYGDSGIGARLAGISLDLSNEEGVPEASTQSVSSVSLGEETVYGECGDGYAAVDAQFDILTGSIEGDIDFVDYCSEGVTLSGPVSFFGEYDLFPAEFSMTTNFGSLNATEEGGEVITLDGSLVTNWAMHLNGSSEGSILMNLVVDESLTGKNYWFKGYRVGMVEQNDILEMEMSGRIYDYDLGYVDVLTIQPLVEGVDDDEPTSGQLKFLGSDGTWATLTLTGEGSYLLEVSDGTQMTGSL